MRLHETFFWHLDDEAGVAAVVDGGRVHPGLEVVDGEGDVLGVGPVEHTDLVVGARHAVAVVVEQDAFFVGTFS